MGRYVYNAGQVTQAIDILNDAINSLADVTTEIQVGINTIENANGARCIEIDYSKLLQLQTTAEEVIEEDIRTIQSKVTVIEDYENAPLYKKIFSSIGMALTKFGEGIASSFEDLSDGAVSIVGFVGGIFNSEFKNSVAEYVATDHVGDWFDKQYDEGFLSGVSKYSWFSEDSTAANIFKGFGSAAPYIALSMTGVGPTMEVIAAGLGGVGSGTEAGINKTLANDPNMTAGDAFNRAFGEGVWQGTKNAMLVHVMNKMTKTINASANDKTTKILDDAMDAMDDQTLRLPGTVDPNYVPPTNTSPYTITEKIFGKTNLSGTKVGQAINSADDVVKGAVNTTVTNTGKVLGKLPGATTAGKIWSGVKNSVLGKTGKAIVNVATSHPGTTYAAASTVFALDQVDEDVINSNYRVQKEIGEITVREQAAMPELPISDTTPGTETPGTETPGTETPGTETPGTETPGTTTPGTETPGTTTPGTETPGTTTPDTTPSTPTPVTPQPTVPSVSQPNNNVVSGGGYTEDGYTGEDLEGIENIEIPETEDISGSFTEIIGGNQYTNIPTSAAPITTTTTTGAKKSVIPVIAGLGAAAVAGLGTKAYLDKKEENSVEEDIDTEEWTEEDSLDIDYNEAMEEDGDYLNPSDEYAYQEGEEEPGSYEAVNSSELASMQ